MKSVNVMQLLAKRVLVTRDSARTLQDALDAELARADREVAIDFEGVEGLTPSFVDELLQVIEESRKRSRHISGLRVVFLHPPTRLSGKFAAIGRAHGWLFEEATDGSWVVAVPAKAPDSGLTKAS